jgi:hypothetical protein
LVGAILLVGCARSDKTDATGFGAFRAVDPNCSENGCVEDTLDLEDDYDHSFAGDLAPGVTSIAFYEIGFRTDGRTARATLAVPTLAASAPLSVAIFDHGTQGVTTGCELTGKRTARTFAAMFATRGALGVALEYPSDDGVQAYIMRDIGAKATLDALRATAAFAEENEIALTGQNGVTGFSQGAYETIATANLRETYAPEVDVRAYAPVAPPIMTKPFWSNTLAQVDALVAMDPPPVIPGTTVAVASAAIMYPFLTLYAWSRFYRLETPFADTTLADRLAGVCVFDHDDPNAAPPIYGVLPASPRGLFTDAFWAAFRDGDWDAIPETSRAMDENLLGTYTGSIPMRIYVGTQDNLYKNDGEQKRYVEALARANSAVSVPTPVEGTHDDVFTRMHGAAADFLIANFTGTSP